MTATLVANLAVPDGKKSIKIFDTEVAGLGVRKMATGIASFIFEKRPKGAAAAKQITLGRCGDWTVDQARAKARQLAVDFSLPDYLSSEAIKGATPTFAEAVNLYDEMTLRQKSVNYRDKTMGTLNRYLLKPLGSLKVSDITQKHLVMIVTPLMQKNMHPTAQLVWEAASNILTWAVRNGHRDDNPLIRIKPEFKKVARDRVLILDELASIWRASAALSGVHKAALRVLMLVPFRKTELLGCHWHELEDGWLSIPATRAKTKEPMKLFISDFASAQLPSRCNDSQLIFTTKGSVPARLGSKIKGKLDAGSGVSDWVMHDFRRAFSTHLHEVSDKHHIIEACLNHKDGTKVGVAGVYNRAEYRSQKQAVLQQWSDIVEAAVGRE
ncbi:site-specific integrase [Alphaproteobacteria bacterium]|nr:site-specific integrase [Alphaproteobacteria bacterium]